jgi:hypothetical protein
VVVAREDAESWESFEMPSVLSADWPMHRSTTFMARTNYITHLCVAGNAGYWSLNTLAKENDHDFFKERCIVVALLVGLSLWFRLLAPKETPHLEDL